jgi:oxaloacetate decarboxylase alpha subunit
VNDVLIYALFSQFALKFLKNKINPRRIRTIPGQALRLASSTGVLAESTNDVAKAYSVSVNGQVFEVEVAQMVS